MFQRAILHFDLDFFFTSIECRNNDSLRGRPLLIGSMEGRSMVSACNYEAWRYGIRAGMPMMVALQRCPDATVLRGDIELYQRESSVITSIIAEESPLFEKAALDQFYIDLTGVDRYLGCTQWSKELRARIHKETGLGLSAGLAVNKLVAKVGAREAKPSGECFVAQGEETGFLAPLSVRRLPALGPSTQHRLSILGVHKIAQLREIPPVMLRREFGKPGLSIWRKAWGKDDSPVIPYQEELSLSREHTFSEDTIDIDLLEATLGQMVIALAFELRERQQVCANVKLKIRYADHNTYRRQLRLGPTANDQDLRSAARRLLRELFQRRQRIRLIELSLDQLSHGYRQLGLFDENPKDTQLQQAMDKIQRRFGEGKIERG